MKTYKPSVYNLVIDSVEDGKQLIFNTLTSAFCTLDTKGQKVLSEAPYMTDSQSEEYSAIVKQLASLGFLVEEDFDERKFVGLQSSLFRYGNKTLALTIGPTLDCNMCCPYCYENKQRKPMTAETADKLISFLTSYIEKNHIVTVNMTWYGGEPLLEMERIEQISNGLIPFCEKNGVTYVADIVTNGFLLSRDYAERLKKVKVSRVQITIDGLEATHNRRRILKNGGDSFHTIIKNIEAAKDLLPISIRVNVDANNLQEIEPLSDFFISEMKWKDNPSFYLAPVEKINEVCQEDPDKCLDSDTFSQLCRKIMDKRLRAGLVRSTEELFPVFKPVSCGAICTNYFVIDADGFIYLCWNHFGNPQKSIGHIDSPNSMGTNHEYVKWLTAPMPEKCKECVYLPLCQGGCADRRMQNQNQPYCSYHMAVCIDNIKFAYLQHRSQKGIDA